jgi:hypothetical protein
MSAHGLYQVQWDHRHLHHPLPLLDDMDDAWSSKSHVEILKSATARSGDRWAQWHTGKAPFVELDEAELTEDEKLMFQNGDGSIPKTAQVKRFKITNGILFITNEELRKFAEQHKRLGLHPLLDRVNYIELHQRSRRARMLRIAQVVAEEGLLYSVGLDLDQEREVMQWMWAHHPHFYNLTIRTTEKVASFRIHNADLWMDLAAGEFEYR